MSTPKRFYSTSGVDGTVYGPVEGPVLSSLHAEGVISDNSCILEEGGSEWKPYILQKPPPLSASNPIAGEEVKALVGNHSFTQ